MILGDGLVLRAPVDADRRRWLDLFEDPEELHYGIPSFAELPMIVADLDERITRATKAAAAGTPGTFVIADADDRFLGTVGWRLDSPALRIADIGYGVHPDARGRGVASRAARLLTRWLTADADGPGLPRVQLDHSVENTASCRTALAAGLEQEGIRRLFLPLREPGGGVRRHDVCLHGFLPY